LSQAVIVPGLGLFAIYIVLLITLGWWTFKNGHIWLGIIGIFIPVLWLVGALLPPKHGAHHGQHSRKATKGRA
jgi:hypothetical protein